MPSKCILFSEEPTQVLPQMIIIQNVHIIDLGDLQGIGSAKLKIQDVSGNGENELFISSGKAAFIPICLDRIYQVFVEATKYAGGGRTGVYTIEAYGDFGVVDTATNVVVQEKVEEVLILTSSSENPIRYIIIRGEELAVGRVCFIY